MSQVKSRVSSERQVRKQKIENYTTIKREIYIFLFIIYFRSHGYGSRSGNIKYKEAKEAVHVRDQSLHTEATANENIAETTGK